MATIVDFLRTGELGDLRCGLSMDDIRAILGEPEDVSARRNPLIWKYGSLQVTFCRASRSESPRLHSIFLYFRDPESALPDSVKLTGWCPTRETTLEEFRAVLADSAIRVDGGATSRPDQYLVLESAARVTFDEGRLDSINYTRRQKTESKQVSVEIPRTKLKAIQQQAAAAGLSVSKLCALWIEERVAGLDSVELGEREWSDR